MDNPVAKAWKLLVQNGLQHEFDIFFKRGSLVLQSRKALFLDAEGLHPDAVVEAAKDLLRGQYKAAHSKRVAA
jgi:hypothetical protein